MSPAPWKLAARRTDRFSLADALERLEHELSDVEPDAAPLEWARRVAGLEGAALDHWWRKASWARAASYAVGRRILNGTTDEVDAIIDEPDWSSLQRLLEQGRGAVVAGAHIGPRLVAHYALRRAGFDLAGVTTNERAARFNPGAIDPGDSFGRSTSLVAAAMTLREGGVFYVAADGRHGRLSISVRFCGDEVHLSSGVPELIRLTGAPSMPMGAYWRNGRLRIEFGGAFPSVAPGADHDGSGKWTSAYVTWLERIFLSDPLAHRLSGGFFKDWGGGMQ